MYKLKPSAGFISTTKRTLNPMERRSRDKAVVNKIMNHSAISINSDDARKSIGFEGDEENHDTEEYVNVMKLIELN